MKYCTHCGKELLDEAVICPNCETKTGFDMQQEPVKVSKRSNTKKIILLISLAVLLVAVIIGGLFVWNHIRTEQVKEQLAGNKFSYTYYGWSTTNYMYYDFDNEANCTYYYCYSNIMDYGNTYEKDYKIKFENGMVFLEFFSETLEVRYNRYGQIEGLYNVDTEEFFE